MIKIENVEVVGWEPALRGMRNPMNSWEKSDSVFVNRTPQGGMLPDIEEPCLWIGPNDLALALKLAKSGGPHAKYRRMIVVYADITAPLYWWSHADQYKVGTVTNSTSKMNSIHKKEFSLDDFSNEHLIGFWEHSLLDVIEMLNETRRQYLERRKQDKTLWYRLIQLLPNSYNQRRTMMLNYEVLSAMYRDRRNHKLQEWREFCAWIETLPYSELITCNKKESRGAEA